MLNLVHLPRALDIDMTVLPFRAADTLPPKKEVYLRLLDTFKQRLDRTPSRAGLWWLSERAAALRSLEREYGQELTQEEVAELLAGAWVGAQEELITSLRARRMDVSTETLEDVLQSAGLRLGDLYRKWRGPESARFTTYLHRILQRDAHRAHRRAGIVHPPAEDILDVLVAPSSESRDFELRVLALRRFIWYHFVSPNNPSPVNHDYARCDYVALIATLDGKSFHQLAMQNQLHPEDNDWGPDPLDDDRHRKWWRNRKLRAQTRLTELLSNDEGRAHFQWLQEQLGRPT